MVLLAAPGLVSDNAAQNVYRAVVGFGKFPDSEVRIDCPLNFLLSRSSSRCFSFFDEGRRDEPPEEEATQKKDLLST